jgi:hypothetical protein
MENTGTTKDTNPKDAIGSRKAPLSTLSMPVLLEMGLGMLEGGCKYGCHNYRVIGVRYSVYFDATMRHLLAAWEGEDIDPDSGLPHLVKAMTSLMVLRDAQIRDLVQDDRPPRTLRFVSALNKKAEQLLEKHPEPKARYLGSEHEAKQYPSDQEK